MGRLYSGNLNDYKDAVARLMEDYDLLVDVEHYRYDDVALLRLALGEALRVKTRSGATIHEAAFEQPDEDVRCIEQTAWLRKVHLALADWK